MDLTLVALYTICEDLSGDVLGVLVNQPDFYLCVLNTGRKPF